MLDESLARLEAGKPPIVPPVVALDMAHCTRGIFAGSTTKDGNRNLVQVALSMYADESERKDTWMPHVEFMRKKLGGSLNNRYGTGIMDENTAGMRSFAKVLAALELFRCAVHRGGNMAKGGAKGDKYKYMCYAAAPTLPKQAKIFAGLSLRIQTKINAAPPEEQSLASKTRDGYGETTSNAIESTWHMIYAARRSNLGRALAVIARNHADRIAELKEAAAAWPLTEVLTPRAKADLTALVALSCSLNTVVIEDTEAGRGTVKSPKDIGPIAVDASKRECATCQTGLACVHLVRIIQAAGSMCQVRFEDLYPFSATAAPWKAMYKDMIVPRPDFSLLVAK
ncbi:hypothetical protein M885DRAFT_625703 [Pelagophyceae sp. CCMP2097]|nr:hypothetical protein M885DRAFT_625703 [Pelagophyceae sp. CCMP2097]